MRQLDRQTVADLGEFGVIARITAGTAAAAGVEVGPGDDAAVVAAPDGRVVVCTDVLVEGRHFTREWVPADDLGRRAAAANMADVAATGARTTALLAAAVLPPDLAAEWVDDLVGGLRAEAARSGASLVGGDLSAGPLVVLAVTALGDLAGRRPVLRSGARPGDVLVLAGTVGRSAAGLALLQRDEGARAPALVAAYRRPEPPYDLGPRLAGIGATAMIDVSDGLAADAGHLAADSGVSVELADPARWAAGWPDELRRVAADADEWRRWLLAGGEDHGLLASVPAERTDAALALGAVVVGTVGAAAGVHVAGRPWDDGGFDHFRPAPGTEGNR